MSIYVNLSVLALRQVLPHVLGATAGPAVAAGVESVAYFFFRHLTDHSQRLSKALTEANQRAWKALETALAGDSLWEQCRRLLASGEDKGFRKELQTFLDTNPLPQLTGKANFRQKCLEELRFAREKGLLQPKGDAQLLAREAASFARHANPSALLAAEQQTILAIGQELRQANCSQLAWLLSQQVQGGASLLVVAVRYFFRRQVESDAELARGLIFTQVDQLTQAQAAGLQSLHNLLARQSYQLDQVLAGLHRIESTQREHGQKLDMLLKEMQSLTGRLGLEKAVRPGVSIRTDQELSLVRNLLTQFRNLPEADRQRATAAQINIVGNLELEVGNVAVAERVFRAAAQRATDDTQRAQAHFNTYRAAVEKRDWSTALQHLMLAVKYDAKRFAPFPMGQYQPIRILGAGGFGVAFLCQHKFMNVNVVVKTLFSESAEQDADKVFEEAKLLTELDHPAIIGVSDCGYADRASKSRPYLVMRYFEGMTLEEYVEKTGTLDPYDLWLLVQQLGDALLEAHSRGILHRDIKPANILVRRDDDDFGWESKIIDFGLALKHELLTASTVSGRAAQSTLDYSVSGTLDYAPPEQLGRLPGVAVGPYSDVYSFGKTCCYALFRTTQPTYKHWQELSKRRALRDWLEHLIAESPKDRYPDFETVLAELPKVRRSNRRARKKSKTAPVGASSTRSSTSGTTPQRTLSTAAPPTTPTVAATKSDAPTTARLVVTRGQKPNAVYALQQGSNLIGRSIDPERYVNQVFEAMDKNKDGRISREEAVGYKLADIFDQIDRNRDGVLDREELRRAAINTYAAQKSALQIDLREQDPRDRGSCSREHARITVEGNQLFIEDLNSTNGTYVNRSRIAPGHRVPLQDDDIIQIGQVHLEVDL